MRLPYALGLLVALSLVACSPRSGVGSDNNNNGNQNDNGNQNNNTTPFCGNGILNQPEQCDNGQANSDVVPNACRMNCTLPSCGDGVADANEDCDASDLAGQTCTSLDFTSGVLTCSTACDFDTSGCTTCGNSIAEGTVPGAPGYETCDGTDFRSATCSTLGFAWGDLACQGCTVDTSGCHTDPAVCGNDTREDTEECDGVDLDGLTCQTLGEGFTGGNLACDGGCLFDRTDCATCGNGTVETGELCDDGNTTDDLTCSGNCQRMCAPGLAECNGNTSSYCSWEDFTVWTEYCDPLQGMTCNAQTGRCEGPCALQNLGRSYVGCDYSPTVTNNALLTNKTIFHFAVAVSNSLSVIANVTVTRGVNTVTTTQVPANGIVVINLPWVTELSDSSNTQIVVSGAYRLRSDIPVTVYQYNPLEYTASGSYTYTNDASLLLPVNTWTGLYRVISRNVWAGYPGFYAVTASENGTTVTVTPSPTGGTVRAGAGIAANGTGTVVLNAGDVLQVFAAAAGGSPDPSDLTGTLITADRPVQVIGGHECTDIPYNVTACDHIEESIPPLETLGTEYLVASPLINSSTTKAMLVRIIATQANTTLTYDPAQAGAPTSIADAGGYIEIGPVDSAFNITASANVAVVQYMLGQSYGGGTGDPAMAIAVPNRQYRYDYLFHAPTNYEANYVNITAPTGATVTLDGAAVSNWTAIGSTGFSIARVQLSNAGVGNHNVVSASPVGISVYGYGQYTSYWYPGGMNLDG